MGMTKRRLLTPGRNRVMDSSGSSFCSRVHGAWSVASRSMDPLLNPRHSASASWAVRSGGCPTKRGPLGPSIRSSVRWRYMGRTSTYSGSPRSRPLAQASSALAEERCTTCMGAPVDSHRDTANSVAATSERIGRLFP